MPSTDFPDGGYENFTDPTFSPPAPEMGGRNGTNDPSFPAAATNSGSQSPYDAVSSFYRSALGRDPESASAVNGWLSGMGGNLSQIQQAIYGTPEAQAYSARRTASVPAYTPPTSSGGAGGNVQDFIRQWQQSHNSSEGIGPLAAAVSAQFPGVSRFMYGQTPSNNELSIDGQKFKVLVDGGGWYTGGDDSGGGGFSGGTSSTPFLNSGTNPGGYTDPSSQIFLNQLLQRLSQANTPQDNGVMDLLKSLAMKRVDALNAPPYSAADEQALITRYREPLTQARDAAYAHNREEAGRKGFLPSSGLLRTMDTNVDKGYEAGIAQGANGMAVDAIHQKQANAQQQLQILSSLLATGNQQVDRGNAQADHAVDLAKMFPDFDAARLDQMLRASSDTSGSSALSGLMQLGNLNLNSLITNNRTDQANSEAWGKLLASIFASVGG